MFDLIMFVLPLSIKGALNFTLSQSGTGLLFAIKQVGIREPIDTDSV